MLNITKQEESQRLFCFKLLNARKYYTNIIDIFVAVFEFNGFLQNFLDVIEKDLLFSRITAMVGTSEDSTKFLVKRVEFTSLLLNLVVRNKSILMKEIKKSPDLILHIF